MSQKTINTTRSEFAEAFLYLKGQPFSLKHYPFMHSVYNSSADNIVFKFSRQTGKSSTLANLMITNSAVIPYFQNLYVAPTVDQARIFSNDRVAPVLDGSPVIKEHYINSSLTQNIFTKQLLNGSLMYIRYALLTADRLRGISADCCIFDEAQDLRADVIPVILETMSHSNYKWTMYAGTPKRTQGTLADLWNQSTMNEFAIKCGACGHWNIMGEENIGLTGVICEKCGSYDMDLANGQWVSTYDQQYAKPYSEGYRVCILHFPNAPWVNWQKDVLYKYENSKKSYFYNEVLALEYDEGASPVTLQDIINACNPNKRINDGMTALEKSYKCVMGIDYGPINSEDSHTVITIMQYRDDVIHVVYMKKFIGKEADYSFIHSEVPRLMKEFNVEYLAADYGMGEASNSEIRSRVGFNRVIAFQHMPSQKEKVRWNAKMPAYTLNRNQVMSEFFQKIKKGKLIFPCWDDTQPYARDLMNVQMEFDEDRNSMKYVNIGPDDFVHSTLYGSIALELFNAIPNIA